MPVYEYKCQKCSHRFELKQSFNESSTVACPKCHGETCRIIFAVPVHYKGSGFYTTDHK